VSIEILEYLIGCPDQFVIRWERVRQVSGATKQLLQDLPPVSLGQRIERLQQMSGCVSHGKAILRPFLERHNVPSQRRAAAMAANGATCPARPAALG
jgi:hypothetical protein